MATLRAVTFNIYNRPWERAGAPGQYRRGRSAALNADVVCLQEAATGWILPDDPVERLAR